MVYRIFVEKKNGQEIEANALYNEITGILQIKSLKKVRVINRYDVQNISAELFNQCKSTVFSEPALDLIYTDLEVSNDCKCFAVSFLPGQFDQRADSAASCIQIISQGERPIVKSAKVYMLYGDISIDELTTIKNHLINPVEASEVTLEEYSTLETEFEIPKTVEILNGFILLDQNGLCEFLSEYGLAMDLDDIKFTQDYFKNTEKRDPTITEIRMIDTYWSDHCRHTTFLTTIDSVEFEDEKIKAVYKDYLNVRKELGREKPINFMDIATLAVKYLRKNGYLEKLDVSDEINACTVKIKIEVDGVLEDYLLLFKNETHNHPTEIEPFGGAATCIGGAIRDPLSGRSYVYAAMRVTGAADPLVDVKDTIKGKLPQRKIVQTAANGYSSYGNQIGLATGIVDEIYHSGYAAKRMEIGAVIGAAPESNVRREAPQNGDIVILLGGKTGRDGCGGATGSSKKHTLSSLESCGAEVQKGNAPEERKLQRLFRNKEASLLIKRCNDFGAGGISVAIGELADGLEINLNAVPKKYEGLDGTELAISESQERMAVVVDKKDVARFIQLANSENLEASVVAVVTSQKRLVMRWNDKTIVDLSREFINSNGAQKHVNIKVSKPQDFEKEVTGTFEENYLNLVKDLNVCSKKGLSQRFDSTIGAGSVLMPFGGKNQLTPIQAMVNKISIEKGETEDVSYMSWGYNPFVSERSPFAGAYLAVVESICKLVSTGAKFEDVYLTFQEYFERLGNDPKRWGKPLSALLGAFKAQRDFKVGAIGGKDSMSGSFEELDVPPTLVSFAVTTGKMSEVISPEFKGENHKVVLLKPDYDKDGLPVSESLIQNFKLVYDLIQKGDVVSAYTPTYGGISEAIFKMGIGNEIGFEFEAIDIKDIFGYSYGSFVLELSSDLEIGTLLGKTTQLKEIVYKNTVLNLGELIKLYEGKLEPIFPVKANQDNVKLESFEFNSVQKIKSNSKFAMPRVLIPVFPGTNCEYDSARAFESAGATVNTFILKNLSAKDITDSVEEFKRQLSQSQIVFIPGGFSGGDEPDGSGKFITAFFRNAGIKDEVNDLLKNKDGLMCGICNGFQALIKLGLVPFGEIVEQDTNSPTLTFNKIARHQSGIVRTRIASNKSPWLSSFKVGEVHSVPISHGEGRFIASEDLVKKLAENGQIATQYVDFNGKVSSDICFNPNGSDFAIEGITSPDGRVFGKMGHTERNVTGLYKNVEGNYDISMFKNAVKYFN